jgi:hypothetical protein
MTISLSSGIISFVGQVSEPVYNWDSSLAKFSSTPKKIKNKNKNKNTKMGPIKDSIRKRNQSPSIL